MPAVIIAILSMTVIGLPLALAVDRRARGPMLLGLAFLYGSGWIFLAMLALAIFRIQWSVVSVAVAGLLGCAVAWLLGALVRRQSAAVSRQKTEADDRIAKPQGGDANGRPTQQPSNLATMQPINAGPGTRDRFKPHWLDIPTAVSIAGFAFFATAAPLWEWDFWAIWGLKARVFLEHGGIDWRFLESHWNAFVHPDYPLLVPLNFDFVSLLNGAWSDRWLGLMNVAWALALLLIVRDLAQRESSIVPAALVTLSITGLAASRYPGLAEGALIAYGAAAVLFIRRALQRDDSAAWRHGALLLGFAANVKNEGVALLVAVAIGLLIVRGKKVLRLWPSVVLVAPWMLLRATHVLPTDIVSGSAMSRVLARLPHAGEILFYLARHLYEPWFWAVVLAGVLIIPGSLRRREAFVLLVTITQLAFYIGSYFATPHDFRWHVVTSWSRLTDQIAIPITVAIFLALAQYALGGQESPAHAEARSDE